MICQGVPNFFEAGRVACREAACEAWRSQVFAMVVRGHASTGKMVLNGAIWCVLEHIFMNNFFCVTAI